MGGRCWAWEVEGRAKGTSGWPGVLSFYAKSNKSYVQSKLLTEIRLSRELTKASQRIYIEKLIDYLLLKIFLTELLRVSSVFIQRVNL